MSWSAPSLPARDAASCSPAPNSQTQKLAKDLTKNGIPAAELHGNLSQNQRDRNLAAFESGDVNVMVATDVAPAASTCPAWSSWCRWSLRRTRNRSFTAPDVPREPAIPVMW